METMMSTATAEPRNILIVCDSFKGSLDSAAVGEALALGWSDVAPHDTVTVIPVGDGGEGTLDAIAEAAPSSEVRWCETRDPQDNPRLARWLDLGDGVAMIELAEVCGLGLTSPLRPMAAHTGELGRVIAHALDSGAKELMIAIGGSASSDGGVGLLTALGGRFLNARGEQIGPGAAGLAELERVDLSLLRQLPERGVTVLVDVTNPLLGDAGAANVYSPQKGADAGQVREIEEGLERLAHALNGVVDAEEPGVGAAGGTGFGLRAWGATFQPGAFGVAEALQLRQRMQHADIVVTGEGRYDAQSANGKLPSVVQMLASASGCEAMLVGGDVEHKPGGFDRHISLITLAGSRERSMNEPERWLRVAGAQLAR